MTTTETAPIVPSFDDGGEPAASSRSSAPRATSTWPTPGLILANAALGEGVETHLFFTFWGFDMINKKTDGRPEVHHARQHRDPHAAGARRRSRA